MSLLGDAQGWSWRVPDGSSHLQASQWVLGGSWSRLELAMTSPSPQL